MSVLCFIAFVILSFHGMLPPLIWNILTLFSKGR